MHHAIYYQLGSGTRLLPFTSPPIQLDASGSYDEDIGVGAIAGLDFLWSCSQTEPEVLSYCPLLTLTGATSRVLTISNTDTVFHVNGSEYTLAVAVSDRTAPARAAAAAVHVSLLPPAAPLITIGRPASVTKKVNPSASLRLDGVLSLASEEQMTWSSDSKILDLAALMLTPRVQVPFVVVPLQRVKILIVHTLLSLISYLQTLKPGVHSVSMVLPPSVLLAGYTYTFKLSAGRTAAPLSVEINAPPRPGSFSVEPATGNAMQHTNTLPDYILHSA
jgi:hypothetical protein